MKTLNYRRKRERELLGKELVTKYMNRIKNREWRSSKN
jgi:hypothetical protein